VSSIWITFVWLVTLTVVYSSRIFSLESVSQLLRWGGLSHKSHCCIWHNFRYFHQWNTDSTVNIWILDKSGFWMLNLCPVVEWSDNRTVYEYQTNLSGFRLVRYSDNHYKNRISIVGLGIWIPDHLKTRPKKSPEKDHSKTGWSGIGLFTVLL
jgi:hypothetical protein